MGPSHGTEIKILAVGNGVGGGLDSGVLEKILERKLGKFHEFNRIETPNAVIVLAGLASMLPMLLLAPPRTGDNWRPDHQPRTEKVRRDVSWPPQRLPCEKARRHASLSEKHAVKRAKHPKLHGPFATYDSAHYQRSGR